MKDIERLMALLDSTDKRPIPNADFWPVLDLIVVEDSFGSRAYSVTEANYLSDEIRRAVREANGDDHA